MFTTIAPGDSGEFRDKRHAFMAHDLHAPRFPRHTTHVLTHDSKGGGSGGGDRLLERHSPSPSRRRKTLHGTLHSLSMTRKESKKADKLGQEVRSYGWKGIERGLLKYGVLMTVRDRVSGSVAHKTNSEANALSSGV
eukprot:2074962-Pyramimonas_sp.AAC.1